MTSAESLGFSTPSPLYLLLVEPISAVHLSTWANIFNHLSSMRMSSMDGPQREVVACTYTVYRVSKEVQASAICKFLVGEI